MGIGEGSSLMVAVKEFVASLAGRWKPAKEDNSAWMTGMHIADDGTFACKSGTITDGMVRLLSYEERKINLKRNCKDANDRIFKVDEDGCRMVGVCTQSGCTYTLTRELPANTHNEPP